MASSSASRTAASAPKSACSRKAWRAVPISAAVRPSFERKPGRSRVVCSAAWTRLVTLTLAGMSASAAAGYRQPKPCRSVSTRGRVGLGPGRLFRLGGGFFGREDIGLHCEGDGASGVRKGQLEVPRQTAERPAVGVDEERRPQPVGEAARLSVQGLPAPAARKAAALAKGWTSGRCPAGPSRSAYPAPG